MVARSGAPRQYKRESACVGRLVVNQQRCSRVVTAAATHTTHTTGTRTRASFTPAIDTSMIPHRRSRQAELRAGFQPELAGSGTPPWKNRPAIGAAEGVSPGLRGESTNSSSRAQPPSSPCRPPTPAAPSTATSTTQRHEVPHIAWSGLPVGSVKRSSGRGTPVGTTPCGGVSRRPPVLAIPITLAR